MKVFVLTEEENLPTNCSFYGINHLLLQQWYSLNRNLCDFELFLTTPRQVLNIIDQVDVVIDRTSSYNQYIQKCHGYFLEHSIKYLNSPKIMETLASKYQTYMALSGDDTLQPRTFRLESFEQLNSIIKEIDCPRIVIKPEWGSDGDGVFFIEFTDQHFNVNVRWKECDNQVIIVKTFKGNLEQFYNENIKNAKIHTASQNCNLKECEKSWIVQEWIDIMSEDGTAFDIRVIEQRDGFGKLTLSSYHGRKGPEKGISVTNLDKGRIPEFEAHLSLHLQNLGLSLDSLFEFCKKVDRKIEKVSGLIGEIGHDVAIKTENGKCSFCYLEGNSMPGYAFINWEKIKETKDINYCSESEKALVSKPLLYCNYLLK